MIGSADANKNKLYYIALASPCSLYVLLRYINAHAVRARAAGHPRRPAAHELAGYHVALHRTLAFGFAAFVSSMAGILFVWWNGHIDP